MPVLQIALIVALKDISERVIHCSNSKAKFINEPEKWLLTLMGLYGYVWDKQKVTKRLLNDN